MGSDQLAQMNNWRWFVGHCSPVVQFIMASRYFLCYLPKRIGIGWQAEGRDNDKFSDAYFSCKMRGL